MQKSSTINCKHCRKPIIADNYLIHEARCQLMSSKYAQNPSLIPESSKHNPKEKSQKENSILRKRQKIFNEKEEDNQRIPCSFCGYLQTLLELDTHPKMCQHRQQQCQSCHNTFPRSLMNQHLQVCPMRHGHISVGQQQPYLEEDVEPEEEEDFNHYGNFQQFLRPQQSPFQMMPGFMGRTQTRNNGVTIIEQSDGRGHYHQRIIYNNRNPNEPNNFGPRRRDINQNPFTHFFALINAFASRNSQPNQGLTKEQLRNLEKISYKCNSTTGEKDLCTICYCQFQDKEKVIRLRCKHLYHEECIVKWLEKNGRCPVCKQVQTNRSLSYEDD